MRKRFFLMLVLGIILFESLGFQVLAVGPEQFEKGVQFYKMAIKKRDLKDASQEKDLLLRSYTIFKNLHSNTDHKPLIMSYLIFLRLQSLKDDLSFFQLKAIEDYVKKEFSRQFPTIAEITILSSHGKKGKDDLKETIEADKKRLLDALKQIGVKTQQTARSLVGQARRAKEKGNYQNAINKLEQSRKIWSLSEASELMADYKLLESKSKQCRRLYDDAIAAKDYNEALAILRNQAAGVLPAEEIVVKENDAKILWSSDLYHQADAKYRKRDLTVAQSLIDHSLKVKFTDKAIELRGNIQKRQKKFAFFMDVGGSGHFKTADMNYTQTYNIPVVADITNENTITGVNFKNSASFGLGVLYFFSPSSGIRASVSSIRQHWKFDTDYYFYWKWLGGMSESRRNSISENANGSLMLINLDYFFQKNIFKDLYLNLYTGPTIHHSKVDLFAGIGFGGVWVHSRDRLYYPEWFPFKYCNTDNGFGIGGNIGGGLEYKFPPLGVFIEFQYFLIPSKRRDWKIIEQPYVGGLGIYEVGEPLTLPNLPEYDMNINFSTFKVVAGVRIYF